MASSSDSSLPPSKTGPNSPQEGPPDNEVVRRILKGESELFEELVRRYQQRVYATLYHMTANHEDATDLTQDAFVKGDSSFYTWVYRIAVNRTLNFLKQRKQRTFMSLNDLDVQVEHDPDLVSLISDRTPERDARLSELQSALNAALLKLSEHHRLVVTLHDIQGLPHEEIARIMECNVGTVRSRLFYARQQLQALLSDHLK